MLYLSSCGVSLSLGALAGCDVSDEVSRSSAALVAVPEQPTGGGVELVYESLAIEHPDGTVELVSEVGELSEESLQRVGRPYSYLHEAFLFHEQAWQAELEGGSLQRGYRVLRTHNPSPTVPPPFTGPVKLDAKLTAFASDSHAERRLVTIGLRDYPDWAPPLRSPLLQSVEQSLDGEKIRDAYTQQRKQLFAERASSLLNLLEQTGGTYVGDGFQSGWVTAHITPLTLSELINRSDISHISDRSELIGGPMAEWVLGQARTAPRMGADVFHAAGYLGEIQNNARHSYADITVAVLDDELEDEGCFLFDGCGGIGCGYYNGCSGPSRLKERIECNDIDGDGDYCETTSNFVGVLDDLDVGPHGTPVASIILGDYSDDQGKGLALGDPAWTSGNHSAAWESDRSGFAPEASLIMFAFQSSAIPLPWWETIAEAEARHVDVLNFSNGYYFSPICDPVVHHDFEFAAENAFDDGILFVASAGNTLPSAVTPGPYGCGVASPGHLLKVLSVTSFLTNGVGCDTNINTCRRSSAFVKGPMAAKLPNGTLSAPHITSIDLAAPAPLTGVTIGTGTHGDPDGTFGATSGAAAVVSGVAALVKDHMLASGNSWINSPGRLHTLMLLMGARFMEVGGPGGTLAQNTVAGEPDWGFGKFRPRLFGTGGGLGSLGTSFWTWSFTPSSSNVTSTLWTSPMPSDTRLLKCVLFQVEDMSNNKENISSLDLQIETYAPGFGSCAFSGGSVQSLTDTSQDVKSVVAATQSSSLANRCARATILKNAVSAWGVTAHLFCYRSNVRDHETPVP